VGFDGTRSCGKIIADESFKYSLYSPAPFQRMENTATYSEARSEYTKQMATFLVPSLVGWFQTLWSRNGADKSRCLSLFQNECEEVARWNQDRIHDEVRVILEKSGCDYMEELMTAVFVAHTKVLTAIRLSTKQKKLSITVPKLDHFIHRIFREASRAFWKTPFLFMESGSVVDRQKNILQVEALTAEAITTAVRGLLPVKQILKDYLEDEEEEVEEEVVAATPVAEETKEEEVKDAKEEEEVKDVKEDEKIADKVADPVVEEATPEKKEESAAPAVVKIDTEQTVHFSDYDSVFDEAKGAPEMRFNPKDEDDFDVDDGEIKISGPETPISGDDAEDLEAEAAPVKAPAKNPDVIADGEFEVLE
jgi:hypothetical protein